MKVRTVAEVENTAKLLEEIGLSSQREIFGRFSPMLLITAARTGNFDALDRVGPKTSKTLVQALDQAGFIRHDPADEEGVRRLLLTIFRHQVDPLLAENNAAYERREGATKQDLQLIDRCLKQYEEILIPCNGEKTLTVRRSLELYFGLFGEEPRKRAKIANPYHTTTQRIQQAQARAIGELANPTNPALPDLQEMLIRLNGLDPKILF